MGTPVANGHGNCNVRERLSNKIVRNCFQMWTNVSCQRAFIIASIHVSTHPAVITVHVGKDSGSALTEKYAEVRVSSCCSFTLFFILDNATAANEARGMRISIFRKIFRKFELTAWKISYFKK